MIMKYKQLFLLLVSAMMLSTTTDAFAQPRITTATTAPRPFFSVQSSSSTTTTSLFMNKKKGAKKTTRSSGGGGGFGSSSSSSSASSSTTTTTTTTAAVDRFPYAGAIRPGLQSPKRVVMSDDIMKPDYAQTGIPGAASNKKKKKMMFPWMIEVKTAEEIEKMKAAGQAAREVLDLAGKMARVPGTTTDEIDEAVHQAILDRGAYPSPLNYHGFPKSCCTSVNEVICHGIPDDRKLEAGDIVNVDVTVYLNGYHGDCSEMFFVGNEQDADVDTKHLLQTTYDCWIAACQFVAPGKDYKDIGAIIEDYIVPRGFSTVRQFCGHGIGSVFHTNPNILHYRNNEPNGQMAAGHTFTIEPMICEGSSKALTWPDEWTATTVDGKRSAQFEHTLLVTDNGVEALTGKNKDSPIQFWERESEIHKGIWLGTTPEAVARQNEINAQYNL